MTAMWSVASLGYPDGLSMQGVGVLQEGGGMMGQRP